MRVFCFLMSRFSPEILIFFKYNNQETVNVNRVTHDWNKMLMILCFIAGGPLHLGDIEELGEAKIPCIVCPWHSWKYSLSTGEIKSPINQNVKVTLYPVVVKDDGSLHVGFESMSPDYFNCMLDF